MKRVIGLCIVAIVAIAGILPTPAFAAEKKKVVLIAGPRSHGYGAHEHVAGHMLFQKLLKKAAPDIETVLVTGGWPEDESVFDGADAVVIYANGGGNHPAVRHLDKFNELIKNGVGIGCIHYGVEVPRGDAGKAMLNATGGYFQTHWSVNPHWTNDATIIAKDHPVTRGVKPYSVQDEWYYHMRFRTVDGSEDEKAPTDDSKLAVTPIISALPPAHTLKRQDGPHSGNPVVRKAVEEGRVQHLMWAIERPKEIGGGRGFGFTGGHFHWNWGHPMHRKVLLNAIIWIAGAEVPEGGVDVGELTVDDLKVNQDYQPRENFSYDKIKADLDKWQEEFKGE